MKKPTLVILAAGMGSRYGGLKQIDPIDEEGHKIIDFSIYDALQAGFGKVIFIIKKEHEQDFRECVGDAIAPHMEVGYVFQDLWDVPEDFVIPEGRNKPWGTTHALMCCRDAVKEPFAVINADDYYGRSAYGVLYDFLMSQPWESSQSSAFTYAMVGYRLKNTLTDQGSVTRGCCVMNDEGYLTEIIERSKIIKTPKGAAYLEDDGNTYVPISPDTLVSMNMWALYPDIFPKMETAMYRFFREDVPRNLLKSECLIPTEMGRLLEENKAKVKVLSSADKWFGVTYQEDKPFVKSSIAALKEQGIYPKKLWT